VGAVAAPIRLADAAVARLLRTGDHVDVLAARADAPLPARTVASAVPVLAVPKPGPDTDEGALIVIQTSREQAAVLARASADSRLSVTILAE
jgi:pilus assembly protein CpaB